MDSKKKLVVREKESHISERVFRLVILLATLLLLVIVWSQRRRLLVLSRYGYIGVFFINFISSATVFLPLPGVASVFLGGAIWNPILVGFASGMGAGFGELSGYFVGFGSRGLIYSKDKKNKWLKEIEEYFYRNGFVTTIFIAIIPFPFFDFLGILAGATNYPIWKFTLATVMGKIIRDIFIAWIGARIL